MTSGQRKMTTRPMMKKEEIYNLKFYSYSYILMYLAIKYRGESNVFYADRFQEIYSHSGISLYKYARILEDKGYVRIEGNPLAKHWSLFALKDESALETLDNSKNIEHPSWENVDRDGAIHGAENN